MKVILFPTDFSTLAENAYLYAIHLAKGLDAKIYVMHSYLQPVLSTTYAGRPDMLGETYQSIELSHFEKFQKRIPHLKKLADEHGYDSGEIKFLFEEGPVSSVVKKIVDSEKIHLIVMGTHGQTGFLEKIIGSNTSNVIKSVHTPLLAIPPHADFREIKKVVFTTLFREKDKAPLREALIMAKEVGAHADCIHVATTDNSSLQTQSSIADWSEDFNKYDVSFKVLDKIESIENTITNYILENNIDILAVVKRNRSFFDRLFSVSISNNLAFHTKVPIMIYHEEK